jgi:hypothetical protein
LHIDFSKYDMMRSHNVKRRRRAAAMVDDE